MELIKATENDFAKLTEFYRYVIDNTENMQTYARWVYGQHPSDEMIRHYIQTGAMYYGAQDGAIVSALAVTPYQEASYHNTEWAVSLADDEAAVVHILCVDPRRQKQGLAKQTMLLAAELSRAMHKKALRLDALACNTPAQRLYESLGFERRGTECWYAENIGWADFLLYEFVL